MKELFLWLFLLVLGLALMIVPFMIQNNRDSKRIYTMVVDIYYTDTPDRDTLVSDGQPIIYKSVKGTNYVAGNGIDISTTAPIKVISNTYREKKQL